MKSAGKARNNGLYRHIRTSKEIIRNLLNDSHNHFSNRLCYYSHRKWLLGFEQYCESCMHRSCYNLWYSCIYNLEML